MATAHAGCFAFLPRSYSGYSPLYASDAEDEPTPASASASSPAPAAVVVVVGKEQKTFMVDRWTLQQEPLRVLLAVAGTRAVSATATARAGGKRRRTNDTGCSAVPDGPIFVDVDEILFEHVLWLARNGDGCADILGMHLRDIIEFYAHEDL